MSGFKGEPVKKINPYVSVHWIKRSIIIQDNMCLKSRPQITADPLAINLDLDNIGVHTACRTA